MKRVSIVFCALFILFSNQLFPDLYRVFFKDKGPGKFFVGSDEYESAKKSISYRSLERRKIFMNRDSIVTIEDVPIFSEYLQRIESLGCKIRLRLKWLNYVVVETSKSIAEKISNFDFVRLVQSVGELIPDSVKLLTIENFFIQSNKLFFQNQNDILADTYFGQSKLQLNMIGIDSLLQFGVRADSIIIGVIDTGFRWKQHKTTREAKILAEWDFINSDSITRNEEPDTIIQDSHGSMVLSILAGNVPGMLIGSSPFSFFVLAKTEDIRSETHFEEDCFAAALEWMDSIGVDVITSSIGYRTFDTLNINYDYTHLDGKTALTSYYANRAVFRGISMVTAAGNRGPRDSTLLAPADAFFEIAVGAVNSNGDSVLNFSSRGPTNDGRIKPDVCALGTGVVAGNFSHPDSMRLGNGTSVACPLVAGGVALLRSAFEEISPYEIIKLLHKTSSHSDRPRNDFGWGIPNFLRSAIEYDILISDPITFPLPDRQRMIFKVNYKHPIESVHLFIRPEGDSNFYSFTMRNFSPTMNYFYDIMKDGFKDSVFYYFILVKAIDGKERRKPFYSTKFFQVKYGDSSENLILIPDVNYSSVDYLNSVNSFDVILTKEILNKQTSFQFHILSFKDQIIQISVFDLLGKEVFKFEMELLLNQIAPFDIDFFKVNSGIYFLRLLSNNGEAKVVRLLVVD
ncbi:MAG: S8 family serine peptidase [Candidatus Kapaibacteriales bacterium]